jgi:hypothetical protein
VTPEESPEVEGPPLDPFAGHLAFAQGVRGGSFRRGWFGFLDSRPEPLDVRADKVLDLAAFGQQRQLIIKPPRPMREDEYPGDLDDRMKTDCERQFILRNMRRLERESGLDEGLPLDRKPRDAGGFAFPELASMATAYAPPELPEASSPRVMADASAWRTTLLAEMRWERYFSKEIKDKFPGPIWRHDPDTNPVPPDPDAAPAASGLAAPAPSAEARDVEGGV